MRKKPQDKGHESDVQLIAYLAAAGAFLAGSTGTKAQLVDVIPDLTCPSADPRCISGTDFLIDFDQDGDAEFKMGFSYGVPALFEAGDGGDDMGRRFQGSANYVGGIGIASQVNSSASAYQNITAPPNYVLNGAFGVDMRKFTHVRFTINGQPDAPPRYGGWMELSVAAGNAAYTIYSYGFSSCAPGGSSHAGQSAPPCSPLAVELISFDGFAQRDKVSLHWETATEQNNAGFEVQMRSADNETFRPIGFVEGHGTTNERQTYNFLSESIEPGHHTFRLKQVDLDGAFEYLQTIEVLVAVPGTHFLSEAYPNPFNRSTSIRFAVANEQQVRLEVFDATGRLVTTLFNGQMEANTPRSFKFDASTLPSGMYVVRAVGNNFNESKKVMLSK